MMRPFFTPIRFSSCLLLIAGCLGGLAQGAATNTILLDIYGASANGKPLTLLHGQTVQLPSHPNNVSFSFGPATNPASPSIRIRYKLDGFDGSWREAAGGEMRVAIRFFDERGDQIDETLFRAVGQSPGWTGTIEGSSFTRRKEVVTVPAGARRFWVAMTSAGPPATVGILAVTNITVSVQERAGDRVLLQSPFGRGEELDPLTHSPRGWVPDGSRPSMARIIRCGSAREIEALAIVDDDRNNHADWHTIRESGPSVSPGDHLLMEWSEMYSVGLSAPTTVVYPQLPHGYYRFRIGELTTMGVPNDTEYSMAVEVSLSFWRTPWFWVSVMTVLIAAIISFGRYLAWRRMQQELQRLEQQRAIEQERLRIAQDIHDDLGARVTQISLMSAMAQRKKPLPQEARSDFGAISEMTRDLVSALYETVWAVNPENDNLDALGNFLCQMANQLCTQAELRCRLEIPDLPSSISISSQARHNLIMATKEALHNVIKHAQASEVNLRIVFEQSHLTVSIQDNGRGFDPVTSQSGNGLANMKRRIDEAGGRFEMQSHVGRGTVLRFLLTIKSP